MLPLKVWHPEKHRVYTFTDNEREKGLDMFFMKQYTEDPAIERSEEIGSQKRYPNKKSAMKEAKSTSISVGYCAVYSEEMEQIAGFKEGKQVQ